MASETELERLVVRLTADNTQLVKTLKDSVKKVQEFATKALGAFGIVMSVKGMMGLAGKAEQAELKMNQLSVAIRINGHAVEQTLTRYKTFASLVEKNTTLTRGETLGMLRQAETLGFSGAQAEAVVKNSIALAGALGGEASQWEHTAVQIARGNFHMIARQLGMKRTATEAQILTQLEKTLNAGLENANLAGQTNEAILARLGRTFDSVKIKIGGLIATGLQPFLRELEDLQTEYKNVEGQSQSTWENAKAHVQTWSEAFIFAIKNIKVTMDLVAADIAHGVVKIANATEFSFKQFWNKFMGFSGFKFGQELVPTPLENALRDDAEKAAQNMAAVFDKYKIENKSKFEKQGKGLGRSLGEGIGKGVKEGLGIEHIEASLAFSVAGLQKQAEFYATGRVGNSKADQHHAENMHENKKQTGLLDQIKTNTAGTPAGLGGP